MADDGGRSGVSYAGERYDLLLTIKSTVDGLLASGSHVTWSTYGGLGRVSDNMERILMHGCRVVIEGANGTKLGISELLNCLKENCSINSDEDDDSDNEDLNKWIQMTLLKHVLSVSLAKFVKSKTRLKHYYYKFAFLRSLAHFQALQHCLRAIEEDNPLLLTSIDQVLLNKRRYMDEYHKERSQVVYVEGSSSDYTSANDDSVEINSLSEPKQRTAENEFLETNTSKETDFFPNNDDDRDALFTPKLPGLARVNKHKPKFSENILVDAALSAAMEPVDVRSEIRWFEGDVVEPAIYRTEPSTHNAARQPTILPSTHGGRTLRRTSNDSLSSNSTVDSLPLDIKSGLKKNNEGKLSEHVRKKKMGHVRSKSDQFRRFRPFGSSKEIVPKNDGCLGGAGDTLSSSLPTNSDVTEFYGGTLGSPLTPSRKDQPAILGYLSSREYDTCHELDKENAHFSISEALISAIEQMKCETCEDQGDDEDEDDGSDEEILRLRAQIKEKKMAKKQFARKEHSVSDTRSSSTTKSRETSVSSGSPHSSHSREPAKSVDSDYNSSGDFPISEHNKIGRVVTPIKSVASVTSLDASSMEISISPISAEQVALSLLEKVASRKNLRSSDLQWMVSEQDVPQSLLPLPTAVPISPDDEMYDPTGPFTRKTSLPCRLRGNLEWAPPRQQIIFNIPPNPKRKEAMSKQRFRCAGCSMRVDPSYVKRFRYCNYLGKYFCNTCHSSKPTVIPARIIQRWDFREYEVSNFARDLLGRVHNDPLFNVVAINKSLYKRVKEIDEVKFLRLQLHHLVTFLRACRYGEKLLEDIDKLHSYIINDVHLYSINDLLEVKSGVFRDRLHKLVQQAFDHVTSCQLCLAKGFICEYCRNGDDIIYPFEVNRCSQCPDCRACYHSECFVRGKCPKCERMLLRKKASEIFNIEPDET